MATFKLASLGLLPGILFLPGLLPGGPESQAMDAPRAVQEPWGLAAESAGDAFSVLGTVAQGARMGEPGLWSHSDGTLFLTFAGCENGKNCEQGPVYRSLDEGANWTRLNREPHGNLAEGGTANSDADVTVDTAGVVYASDLVFGFPNEGGNGFRVFRSTNGGTNWTLAKGDLVPRLHWADRQWMAAADPGHVVMAWVGGANSSHRAIATSMTRDAGATWTPVQYYSNNVGWIGPVVFDAAGTRAFALFTDYSPAPVPALSHPYFQPEARLMLLRSLDGGATWEVVDAGVRLPRTPWGLHWAGALMAPALDITGTGRLVAAWSEEVRDPTGTTTGARSARVRLATSADWGVTWTEPVTVSGGRTAVFAWVTAGTTDRAYVTYYASDSVILDSDYEGTWDVEAALVDKLDGAITMHPSVVEGAIHEGGICARGTGCFFADRSLLDFFEADRLPDGRLMIVYGADAGQDVAVRVAVQISGPTL